MFCIGSSYIKPIASSTTTSNIDTRLEYLIGDWKSTGFVTDAQNLQQKIEMNQHIAFEDNKIVFTGTGINPINKYRYNTSKAIFLNERTNTWRVEGKISNKYTLDNKVYITEANTLTYTFYDNAKNLMRYTILKENDDGFTETEELWTDNGWDKTAWMRTKRTAKSADAARPLH